MKVWTQKKKSILKERIWIGWILMDVNAYAQIKMNSIVEYKWDTKKLFEV